MPLPPPWRCRSLPRQARRSTRLLRPGTGGSRQAKIPPEIALARLQLAELLIEHYPDEKAEALEHLDFAIGEFRMKMQPSLDRALKQRETLKA
jgi:hypothetical protein